MYSRFTTIFLLTLFSSSLHAEDRKDVLGFWASEGSIFMIYEEAEQLHGEIIALEKAYYTAEERPDAVGQPRLDDNNPVEVLSQQPIVGLQMFSAYEFDDGQWRGKIYDPESGNTYQSKMKLSKKGKLEIRGYIGVPMFGRTSTFDPVSSCQPHIVEMLTATEHRDQC
jgi:hypothetical protein